MQSTLDDVIERKAQYTTNAIAWAYRLSPAIFQQLIPNVRAELSCLCRNAKDVSVMIRRDVLSVRMSVSIGPRSPYGYLAFDPSQVSSVWPEMGAELGDDVVGVYRLGLTKQSVTGKVEHIILPEVFTSALLQVTAKN